MGDYEKRMKRGFKILQQMGREDTMLKEDAEKAKQKKKTVRSRK